MDRITELEVVASFLGRRIVPEQLERHSAICLPEYAEGPDCAHYSIELSPMSANASMGTTLSLQIIVEGEILISAHIRKFVHLHPIGERTSGYETNPTNEELDAVGKLLSILTEKFSARERGYNCRKEHSN